MIGNPYSCEKTCPCNKSVSQTQFLVVTGGPGAGKTAVLELVRKVLCEHIAILPEAASILFGGGFWRLNSASARKSAQKTIYCIQSEMQNLVANEQKWALGLCDRGTLDGAAYWPGDEMDFCKALNTTVEKEYAKYVAVLHLSSPGQNNGYNHQNPIRIESAEEALKIDQRIHAVWKNHPNYNRINSTEDFLEKAQRAALLIHAFLPECCREHLKSKAKPPSKG